MFGYNTYPRDAMLAQVLCHVSVCLYVCLSQVEVLSKRLRIELDFGIEASFYLSYTVLKGDSGIFKNKGNFLWNFVPNVPNSGHRKFCFGISIFETCYRLSSTQSDWTKLTIPPSPDA